MVKTCICALDASRVGSQRLKPEFCFHLRESPVRCKIAILTCWVSMSKSKFISTLIFCAFLGSSPLQAASCPAANLIQDAGSAFSAAARSGSPSAFTSAASRFTDLRGIAMFALGSFGVRCHPAKRANMSRWPRDIIGRFMADNASSLAGSNNLTITSCSGNSVSAKMASGGTVIFRLSRRQPHSGCECVWHLGGASTSRQIHRRDPSSNGGDVNALFAYLAQ